MSLILGIESSCDETAASVVKDGREILSNVISTQIEIHKKFGGVVPEIASRKHLEIINAVVDEALNKANITFNEIDAIGVTYGPGLVGALLVGVSAAKAYAFALNKPLVPVHHIRGHICANFIEHKQLEPPFICLVASGGHSHIVHVKEYTEFEVLGRTRDDAAGEAFDKVARILGLPYPGGPEIDKCAATGDENFAKFKKVSFGEGCYDFSFSGIKTGVMNFVNNAQQKGEQFKKEDIAASFQKSVVEVLVDRLLEASDKCGIKKIALAGGVAANSRLRKELESRSEGYDIYFPSLPFCTDNAAMIASSAYYEFLKGNIADMTLNAVPYLDIENN